VGWSTSPPHTGPSTARPNSARPLAGRAHRSHARDGRGGEREPDSGAGQRTQPDACLYILPEYGGRVREDENEYLTGAPEPIVEIGFASESIDLHAKKQDYEKAGVDEYVVLALRMQQVFWFLRRRGKY
jgi:Uma2 family endonuclease